MIFIIIGIILLIVLLGSGHDRYLDDGDKWDKEWWDDDNYYDDEWYYGEKPPKKKKNK